MLPVKTDTTVLHRQAQAIQLPLSITVLQLLIEDGAAVNARDEEGSAPINSAVFGGHIDIVKVGTLQQYTH